MNDRELFKSLKEQGFETKRTKSGIMVMAPNGEESVTLHTSYMNEQIQASTIGNLKRIGYVVPEEWAAKAMEEAKKEREEKPFVCKYGCGRRFAKEMHRGRHESTVHKEEWEHDRPAEPSEIEVIRRGRVTVTKQRPESPAVRIKDAFKKVDRALEIIHEQGEIIVKESEELYEEHKAMKTKIRRVEESLGRALDSI